MKCLECKRVLADAEIAEAVYCAECYGRLLEENQALVRQVGIHKSWARSLGNAWHRVKAELEKLQAAGGAG